MKCGAIAPDKRRNADQKEKIAQAADSIQKIIPATDIDALNALGLACGANTTAQALPVQIANPSGQSDSNLVKYALA